MSVDVTKELSAKFANMGLLCACMVVMRHIGLVPDKSKPVWWIWQLFVSYEALTMVAVPFFFLASGFFLGGHIGEEKWYLKEVGKRVKSLLVPFVVWNGLYLAFVIGLEAASAVVGFNPNMPIPAHASLKDLLNAAGLNPLCSSALGPLWFIRTLFVFVLVSPVLCRFRRMTVLPLSFALMVVALSVGMRHADATVRQIIEYTFSFEGLFYFVLGMYMRRNPVKVRREKMIGLGALVGGLVIFAGLALCRYFTCETFYLSFRLIGTALLMLGLWSFVPTRKVLESYSAVVFPIYLLHKFYLVLLAGVVTCIGWRNYVTQESILLYFARLALVLLFVRLTVSALKRFLPRMSNVMFGGRI